jgi:hypothetical protein
VPVHVAQEAALNAIGVSEDDRSSIFAKNFNRLFPDGFD